MDLKSFIIAYTIFLLIISIVYFSPNNIVFYEEDYKAIDKGYFIVYRGPQLPVLFNVYYVFKSIDNVFNYLIRIKYIVRNLTYGEFYITNIRYYYYTSNDTPIIPTKTVLNYMDYSRYLIDKVAPILIGMGINSRDFVIDMPRFKYFVLIISYSVKQDVIVDLKKYVPPIIYYPNPPPPIDLLYNIVIKAINTTYYQLMLRYLADKIDSNTGSLIVFREYYISSHNLSLITYGGLFGLWLLLVIYYDVYLIPRVFKELIYTLVLLVKYLVKILKELVRHISQ
jgi:hypothetical protein